MKTTRNMLTAVVIVAAIGLTTGATDAATTTITGTTGGHDSWNVAGNWDAGVPSGAIDVEVGAGVTAQVDNALTPTYSGTLTLNTNSTLQLGWTSGNNPGDVNPLLSASQVTMNGGSELRLRNPFTVTPPPITMAGDGRIHLSPSTSAHHRDRNFDNPITGTGDLTVIGNNNNTLNLNVANSAWSGDFVADADDGWRVEANVSGVFGAGDVTFNARTAGDRGATLQIDAPDVIADTAALFLNGPRDQRKASKLILNASDTIAGFWVDGAQQPAGTYDSSSGLTDTLGNALITGSGVLTVTGGGGPPPPTPVSILSTDFTGRTVSGATASNIPWVTNGVADPGDLTAIPVGGGTFGGLFDTADAQGHFAPDRNTGNEGPWSVDIPIDLTAPEVVIEDIVLDWQHFNNSGDFQGANRSVDWTATVTGSVSGDIGTKTALNVSGTSGLLTITFDTPLTLTNSESWTLQILAEGSNSTGNNTGLDAIDVLGQVHTGVIPEPVTLALLGLAACGVGAYVRRRPNT